MLSIRRVFSGSVAVRQTLSHRSKTVMAAAQAERQKGVCKWFNVTKGFGFITPDEGDTDLFVHQTAIQSSGFRSLRDGEAVEFFVETGDDGRLKAVAVSGPNGAEPEGAPKKEYNDGGYGGGYGGGGGRGGGGGGYGRRGGRGGGGGYGGQGYGQQGGYGDY